MQELHDDDAGSELVALSNNRHGGDFDRVPLNDQRALESDPSDPADPDYDPVLSNSLNSRLTGTSYKPASLVDRFKYWLADPENKPRIRICQVIAACAVLIIVITLVLRYRHSDSDDAAVVYSVRLPHTVYPSLYTMNLNASLVAATFDGDMAIAVSFKEVTNQILFHQKDLTLTNIWLAIDGGVSHLVPLVAQDTGQYDLYLVQFDRYFPVGATGVLHIRFAGLILPTLAGFYLSNYTTASGAVHTIASTQFESTDARRAFPCFDEPSFKANFSITIITEASQGVLSNMPLRVSEAITLPGGLLKQWPFETTFRMSTYLVAYCITDFVSREKLTKRGIPVRVWTAIDKIGGVDVALEAAVVSIERYDEFFEVLYPLPKSDHVAIPNFPVGAMENWGLITYRESALLINNASAEAMTEQNIVATVAHELAHQWFGNLVTMAWWQDLWLNEGFASYVEWIGIRAYAPNWDADAQMVADSQSTALELDSSQYSHAIVQTVNDPAEIDSLFDSISYDKGCSVIMMLASVLGFYDSETNFQLGLHAYLTTYMYGNAVSDQLWSSLQTEAPTSLAPETVMTFMHKFTTQVGYPLVTVAPDASGDALVLTQDRFLMLPYEYQNKTLRDTQSQYRWDLSIVSIDSTSSVPSVFWFNSTDASVSIPYDGSGETQKWLYLNKGRYGFYRVNYPVDMWLAISEELRGEEPPFTNSDLVGLLDDAWTLALAGDTTYAVAFNVSTFLADNSAYTPWKSVLSQIGRVSRLLDSKPEDAARFSRFVVERLIHNNTISLPPWDGYQDHLLNLLQASFVSALVAYNDTTSRAEASRLFTAFMTDGTAVQVNIRDAVYRVGIEDGGVTAWNFLYDQYRTTLDPSESRRILRALTRSFDPALLEQIMDWSLDSSRIKSQDTSRIIIYVAYNRIGKTLAWEWIQANYAALFARFGSASFTLSELISDVIGLFQTQTELDAAQTFFADKDLGTAARALMQAYETVQVNMYWIENRYPEFSAALAAAVQS